MSTNTNAAIEKILFSQFQKSGEQMKTNPPLPLPKSGAQTIISNIPAQGYLINQPGTYVFEKDINWTPPDLFSTAIIISCSDVVLDLKGWKLTATGGNSSTSVGIKVTNDSASCNNVSIQNGTLSNMGYCGLSAVNTSKLSLSKITVDGLSYPSFDVLPSGIFVDQTSSFILDNCTVTNVNVTAVLGAGILIMNSNTGIVNCCTVQNVTNNDGVAGGYVYNKCTDIQSLGCNASNLHTFYQGDPLSVIGHTCIGFMPTQSQNLAFTQCSATGITGCCDDCHGMSLFSVDTVTVIGFYADQISDGDCPAKTGAKATGLEVYGNNVSVFGSVAKNISAMVPQDLQATGFSACGTSITFEDCYAENVQVVNSNKQPDTQYGYGTGFGWAPDPRPHFVNPAKSVTYTNCISQNCQVGFDTWNHQNSVWNNPSATGCPVVILVQPKGAVRNYSMNFCSELPNSNPLSPAQKFPITNCAENNQYPNG